MQICSQCKLLLPQDASSCPEDGAPLEEVKELPMEARLGGYRLKRKLGEGGMGLVCEAHHEVLGRRAAIKFLHPQFASNKVVVTRFIQEAKSVNLINHENIINIYDFGNTPDGGVYFVMEYLEGITLGQFMRKAGQMKPAALVPLFLQMMKALCAAHEKDIIHRDLKPANVFLTRRDENPYFVKLLDFGVAKLRGEGSIEGLTRAGALIGTPQYMSPEQISGGQVDARSDIFSMGVMLYRAVVGKAPFEGKGLGLLAKQILFETPPAPRELAPLENVPESLNALIMKALEKDPAARFQTMREMLFALNQIREELGIPEGAAPTLDGEGSTQEKPEEGQAARGRTQAGRTTGSQADSAVSLPIFQGALESGSNLNPPLSELTAEPPRKAFPVPLVAGGAAAAVFVGVLGTLFLFGGAPKESPASTQPAAEAPASSAPSTIEERYAAGDAAGARALAKEVLKEGLSSGDATLQAEVVVALSAAGSFRVAPLLYTALGGPPNVRREAARGLEALKLPEAAPKVREALSRSGDRLKVDLAACLLALGDREGLAILTRALEDPGTRLVAARALAQAGEKALAEPVLKEIFQVTPLGRTQWQQAAEGLLWLGDEEARAALTQELSQKDASRAVAAAEALSRAGDESAAGFLLRVMEDPAYPRRPEVAKALARQKNAAALPFVAEGLADVDASVRQAALFVAAHLAKEGGKDHEARIAALATSDPDRLTRLTAAAVLLALE